MAQYVRKPEVVDAWEITPALIAAQADKIKSGVINPNTGLPVAPEEEEQALNAGWKRVLYLHTGGDLAPPLTIVRLGDYVVRAGGQFSVHRKASFEARFELAP